MILWKTVTTSQIAMVVKEGVEKTGRFKILSKDIGIPVVAFSLKDRSRYNEFKVSEGLRRHQFIVPAYHMPCACGLCSALS